MKRELRKYRLLMVFGMTFTIGSVFLFALRPKGEGVLVVGAVSSCSYVPEGPKSFQFDSSCIAVLEDGSKYHFSYYSRVDPGMRVEFLCQEAWLFWLRHCTVYSVG